MQKTALVIMAAVFKIIAARSATIAQCVYAHYIWAVL